MQTFSGVNLAQAAAEHGEVLRINVDQAPVDSPPTGDHAVSQVFLLIQAEIDGAVLDEGVDLAEGSFVEQQINALSSSQASALVLGFDAFWTSALTALCFELAQFFDLRVITHE